MNLKDGFLLKLYYAHFGILPLGYILATIQLGDFFLDLHVLESIILNVLSYVKGKRVHH